MKYVVRSLKYFAYLCIVLALFIGVLYAFGLVGGGIDGIFKGGRSSLWKIAGIVAAFAAVYPTFGFGTRRLMIPGAFEDIRDALVSSMAGLGYELERQDGENLSFRKRSGLQKAVSFWEDRLTFTRCLGGFDVEGRTKDVLRAISSLER